MSRWSPGGPGDVRGVVLRGGGLAGGPPHRALAGGAAHWQAGPAQVGDRGGQGQGTTT